MVEWQDCPLLGGVSLLIDMNETQAKELTERLNLLKVYEEALIKIEKFGHSQGHGHGYTCANIAEKALKNQ
jgi:hypothetical protein